MSMIKQAWNKEISETQRGMVKTKALRGLFWLLLLMIVCTLLARVADGMTVALVRTSSPGSGSLRFEFKLDGYLVAGGDVGVSGESGMLVTEMPVSVGDWVEKGDVLLIYDQEPILEELKDAQRQLEETQVQLKAAKRERSRLYEEQETNSRRVLEDQESALLAADKAIEYAQKDLEMAQEDLRRYQMYTAPEIYSKVTEGSYLNAIALKERALEQAQQAKLDVENTYARLIEDSEKALPADASKELYQLQADELTQQIQDLQALLEEDGKLLSPMSGVITSTAAAVGRRTDSQALFYLNDLHDLRFEATVPGTQAERIAVGDKLSVTLPGREDAMELTVASLTPSREAEDAYELTAYMEEAAGLPGQSAQGVIRLTSENYDTLVPISALRTDGMQRYILAVQESQTALGLEHTLYRIDVEVLDSNESMAAVDVSLNRNMQIVTGSSRVLREGDRVRLGG